VINDVVVDNDSDNDRGSNDHDNNNDCNNDSNNDSNNENENDTDVEKSSKKSSSLRTLKASSKATVRSPHPICRLPSRSSPYRAHCRYHQYSLIRLDPINLHQSLPEGPFLVVDILGKKLAARIMIN
jgi:hypothetical protein